MKKFSFRMLSLSMMMFLGVFAFGQFTTTFNVDMTDAEGFDAATDEIFMSGSFAGWAQPGTDAAFKMTPVEAGSMVYTLTATVDSGEVQYKYFRVIDGEPSWDNGEWTGDPNRMVTTDSTVTMVENFWGTTGIFDVKAEFAYSMYPNPANDYLTVANTADVSQVDIYDVTGKMVMTVNVASENITLNVSDLNTGMYIINVTNEKGVQTSKFVKN